MILIDANILLYAFDPASEQNPAARHWFEKALSGNESVGLPWTALLAFLRIGTSSRVFREPLSIKEAIAAASGWLERPIVSVIEPGERYWETLCSLLVAAQIRGADVMDANLAALAIEKGATLATADRSFARFPGLSTFDPLAG